MTKDTLVYLAGLLVRIDIKTGTDDWREAAQKIAIAQDEIAAELTHYGLTWVPPGVTVTENVPVAMNGASAELAPNQE